MPKFLSPVDLTKNELLNARVQNLSSDPSSPVEGQIYMNTTNHVLMVHNGTSFINFLDRASHTGTQSWSTITGTPTTVAGYGITNAVTAISVTTGNGVSATSSGGQTPSLSFSLGAITPTSVAATGTVTGSNISGTNTGDQTTITGNAGSATVLQTARTINGTSFNGSANITITADANTLTNTTLASGVVNSSLTSVGTLGSLTVTGNITINTTPTAATHAATKGYVDTLLTGLSWKSAVKAASTGNLTLSGTQTVDGVALVANDRVLVKNQTTASQNGIYVVAAGAWTRATDSDTAAELDGAAVYILQGTSQADTAYTETATITTIGTDTVTFVQFAANTGAAAAGTLTGTTLASNVVNSSLTSVGTLTGLTVSSTINGSITGNAATVTTNANLTGDVTSTGNATTLATVNSNVGSFTNASITVDAKGRITAASTGAAGATLAKFTQTFGNGSATTFTFTHNLNTRDCSVTVREAAGSYAQVEGDIAFPTVNTVTFTVSTAPTASQYSVVIIG